MRTKHHAGAVLSFALASAALFATSAAAETWSQAVTIESIKPLASWQGGLVRVVINTNIVTSNCGTTNEIDFGFSGGTQESRSAVLGALYVAFATARPLKFALHDTSCSVASQPLFTGVEVLNQ
ncbi:hypothetical protein GCM10011487_54760 [Steroidobacter agaridevorans]|uniref:Uncharacterized protein n=1 Tax=Steroidobacter agaridevorans TaxID=2695856 RepID=A0A829YLU8_9GAMM|nr:hypothetical protein [Steroidobacter agaridevorans]GFE83476.1 hypothetical protein GCM10011487_54760 [Steroidobacter agaridevorans]